MRHFIWPLLASCSVLAACDSGSEIKIRTSSYSDESDSGVLRVIDGLQCPQTQDVLTRRGSASADGRSCNYAGPRGSEVELQLLKTDGASAREKLKAIEERLSQDLPAPPQREEAPPAPSSSVADTHTDGEYSSVHLPGLKVDSQGDRATVRLPGMKIEADGDRSEVRIGGIVIRSDAKSASNHVRLTQGDARGLVVDDSPEATRIEASTQSGALRANYRLIIKGEQNQPWRAVGYDARGPVGGPIVIAITRSRDDNNDRVFEAAKDLVTLNVGN